MTGEPEQYERYERYAWNSSTRASIGRILDRQVPEVGLVPDCLRRVAVDAWERNEEDPVPAAETDTRCRIRDDAGVLALTGLSVLRAEQSGGAFVLASDLVNAAVAAAHHQLG